MVVIDGKMARYHGKHVDQYVLTLMSVVALIFRDASIGNRIDIAVVEVLRPERQSFVPKRSYENNAEAMGKSAEEMLKMFCKWQKQGLKYNTNHPRRYDTALLLTRENICRNPWTKSCDTLGLAELGTMCSKHSSCSIVQDNGLSAAFTIAHELGHLLNMPHDNDDKCKLIRGSKDDSHRMNVMSRMLDHNTLPWVWSNCSRHILTEYLNGGHGRCLEEEAWTNKLVEEKTELTLAGELFNASKQCQYVFGKSAKICPHMPPCKRLWCTTAMDEKEGCRTQHMPWADGTVCEVGKWCLRGKCVDKNKGAMKKVDGQWGDWLPWSACSRTCGVGVRRSERGCDYPKPQYGGRYCTGERVRYESCIMRPCSSGAIDFRTQQCQAYNKKNFGLPDIPEDVKWIPKYASIRREDSCKLFCQVYNNSRTYFQLREKVEDGTPCGPDTYDICVNGECRVAGCDYVLNSTAKADSCGVCNGDNSTCKVTSGSIVKSRSYGYTDIVVVPEGAAMVDVTQGSSDEQAADDNYLALMDVETGEYLLNGHWIVTPFQKLVEFGGTLIEYTGSNAGTERINSTKPLQKRLLVQILSVGNLTPPHVKYSYTKSNLLTSPNYYWRLGEWSNCTESCIGERQKSAYCVRADTGEATIDEMCLAHPRPATVTESCAHTCPASWTYKEWSACGLSGETCLRRREVMGCVSSLGDSVKENRCEEDQQATEEVCPREECPYWQYHEWSPCKCANGNTSGERRRLYSCRIRDRPISRWQCEQMEAPKDTGNCSCWYAEAWSSLNQGGHSEHDNLVGGEHHDKRRRQHPRHRHLPPDDANDIPNALPGLDDRDLDDKDFLDNRVDGGGPRYDGRRGKERGGQQPWARPRGSHRGQHHSSEEESNSVVQEYDHDRRYKNKNNWQTGDWGRCSRDCGGGQKRRQVVCMGPEETCPLEEKPADVASCNSEICTEWSTGGWGHCHTRRPRCGRGTQQRLVVCRAVNGVELAEERCHQEDRPTHVRPCKTPCHNKASGRGQRYRWKTGDWSTCSEECGRGVKQREITCVDTGVNINHGGVLSGEVQVHSDYCLREGLSKPREKRGCNTQPCSFRWASSPWSECSKWCDAGLQFRDVSCHTVNALGWRDPEPVAQGCSERKRPRNSRKCNLGDCAGGFFWRVRPWKPCQASCGQKGRQRRSIYCVDANEQKTRRSMCPKEHRPKRRQKCTGRPCGFTTCAEAREALQVTVDGEYSLLVAGMNMSIFCLGMNSTSPTEYLTLPAGEEGNFAEMYNKILFNPETCPHEGKRRSDCDCEVDESDRSGYTAFSRIRLNTTSLSVDAYDFTFARAVEGRRLVPYGEAGDCYSKAKCPQGGFSINLAGTELAVSSRTTWLSKGSHAAHWINRLDDNQRILGRCGGYCGTCTPDPSIGIKLGLRDG
nr:A disintegrin and metalloproteinase with thrombospondin motifs 9-like isoform X2 [Penaeus vannamei]